MKLIKEFKEFISRGNVIELAVGIIIGTAFTAIVKSFVKDIITPLIAWIFGNQNFDSLFIVLRKASEGKNDAVLLTYGAFITAVINFILIAIVLFFIVKSINKFNNLRKEKEEKQDTVSTLSNEEILLAEIRDLLKKN